MLQTVLMFHATSQNVTKPILRFGTWPQRMATPGKPAFTQSEVQCLGEPHVESRISWLNIVGNALGFFVLIAGLWLELRLAEALLY